MTDLSEFAPAFLAAQRAMQHAVYDAKNTHFRSSYATLGAVIDAVKSALNDNGICFFQREIPAENGVAIETTLLHTSGQSIAAVSHIPLNRADAHGVGSAYTYARRYGLSAICGIFSEADDDGNRAQEAHPTGKGKTSTFRTAWDEGGIDNREVCESFKTALEAALFSGARDELTQLADDMNRLDDQNIKRVVWKMLSKADQAKLKSILGDALA